MAMACSTNGRHDRCIKGIGGEMDINQLEDLGTDARILRQIFKKWDGEAQAGFIWLRLGTAGGRLSMR